MTVSHERRMEHEHERHKKMKDHAHTMKKIKSAHKGEHAKHEHREFDHKHVAEHVHKSMEKRMEQMGAKDVKEGYHHHVKK